MYILKNAWKNIVRNKGRNILIGIIIIVISAACSITLAIRQSANDIVDSYLETNKLEATIGMNRRSLVGNFKENNESQEDMIESFNNIESLTQEEIDNYGSSEYVTNYYYYYSLSVDAKDLTEAADTLMKETTETKTRVDVKEFQSSDGSRPGRPGGGTSGSKTTSTTTTKKTEKITNAKAANGAFTLVGYDSYEDMSEFINGEYTITDGEVSSDFSSNSCVISEELATLNNLKVGDTITIVDPNDTSLTYTLTITGIYTENTEASSNMSSMFTNSANKIITNVNFIKSMVEADSKLEATITPTYILKDESVIESFTNEVSEKGLNEYYEVTTNVNDLNEATESVKNVKTFATTFLIITLIIGGVVLAVINMINIRERKYEIGVLRTIGMKKAKLSIQFMFELLIVSFVSLIFGAIVGSFASVPVANKLLANEIANQTSQVENISKNFGKREQKTTETTTTDTSSDKEEETTTEENKNEPDFRNMDFGVAKVNQIDKIEAVVDYKVLLQLLGIGVLLTLISSLASMIAIARFSPLTILKER